MSPRWVIVTSIAACLFVWYALEAMGVEPSGLLRSLL